MASLRGMEGRKKYEEYRKKNGTDPRCSMCEETAVRIFSHWKVIENNFPYDLVADKHDMLVPIRHVTESSLNEAELAELRSLKAGFVNENYDCLMEPTNKNKTIPNHFHIHLLVVKDLVGK